MNLDRVGHVAEGECEINADGLIHLKRDRTEYLGFETRLRGAQQI